MSFASDLTDLVSTLKTALAAAETASGAVTALDGDITDAERHVTDLKDRRAAATTDHETGKAAVVTAIDGVVGALTDYRATLAPPEDPPSG